MATPTPDRAAAAALGAALRRLGYVEEKLEQLLDEDAFAGGREEVLVAERRLPKSKLATAVRLLFLQLPVPEADVAAALGPHAVEALVATGLAEVVRGDVVRRRGSCPSTTCCSRRTASRVTRTTHPTMSRATRRRRGRATC